MIDPLAFIDPAIVRDDCSEEQLLQDITHILCRNCPFRIEPALTIIRFVNYQMICDSPTPQRFDQTLFVEFSQQPDLYLSSFPSNAMELAYTLLKGY